MMNQGTLVETLVELADLGEWENRFGESAFGIVQEDLDKTIDSALFLAGIVVGAARRLEQGEYWPEIIEPTINKTHIQIWFIYGEGAKDHKQIVVERDKIKLILSEDGKDPISKTGSIDSEADEFVPLVDWFILGGGDD